MDYKVDIITEEDCYKILKSNNRKNAHVIKYSVSNTNDMTVGFLGNYFHLKIWYEAEGQVKEDIYFLKTEPLFNQTQRNFVQDCGVFKKEAFLYEKVIPELMKLVKVNFAPHCILIKEEVLVLEDLRYKKFNIVRRDYTLQECQTLIKTLAYFHCSSIIYEEKMTESGDIFSFKQYMEKLPEATFSFDEGNQKYKWLKCVTSCVIDFMRTLQILDENIERKLLTFVFGGDLDKSIRHSNRFRNVLTHNDLWANNIFLGINDKCKLIDFQLVRYTPPVYDLIMALFLNNSIKYIEKYFESSLGLYYDTFSNILKDHLLSPDVIFPLNEFNESVEIYKLPALIEAIMFAITVYLPEEKSAYIKSDAERYQTYTFINRTPFIMDTFKKDKIYRKKISGLLITLAEALKKEILS